MNSHSAEEGFWNDTYRDIHIYLKKKVNVTEVSRLISRIISK